MFPEKLKLSLSVNEDDVTSFRNVWEEVVELECHKHKVWHSDFINTLKSTNSDPVEKYQLAAVWAANMISGAYCFPRYVAALASRAEQDYVRHGLLENAWDESGGPHHQSRSHFWLAVRLVTLLGFNEHEIEKINPLPEAQKYSDTHFSVCNSGDFGSGLGMICLIEEFTTPEFTQIFKSLLDSCELGAGIKPEKFVLGGGAEYFTANISDDERHREEMPRLVLAYLKGNGITPNNPDQILDALKSVRKGMSESISLREDFYEGIYKYVKSGGTFQDMVR